MEDFLRRIGAGLIQLGMEILIIETKLALGQFSFRYLGSAFQKGGL